MFWFLVTCENLNTNKVNVLRMTMRFLVVIGSVLTTTLLSEGNGLPPLYLDKSQPVDARVSDLMSRMTLEEKAAQLVRNCAAFPLFDLPRRPCLLLPTAIHTPVVISFLAVHAVAGGLRCTGHSKDHGANLVMTLAFTSSTL